MTLIMLWKEERSRIRAAQKDNLRDLLGIRRMYRVPNARIRELCRVTKGVDKRVDEGVLWWFGHVERGWRMIQLLRECAGSHSVVKPHKRWTHTMKDCLRKRGLDVREARRMVQDRSKWWGFMIGNAWGVARGMNPRP